jgi:hypothetical protein
MSANTYADCYVNIGKGSTSENVFFQEIRNGNSTFSKLDKSGSATSLGIGCPISERIFVSIEYIDLSENFELLGTEADLNSKSLGASISLDLYESEKLKFAVGAGYGKWESKTQIAQARWDFSTTPITLFFENRYHSSDGYTPYAHIDLTYFINSRLSLGIQYNYYHKIGYVEPIIDYDALFIGDIPGAIKVGDSKFSSVEAYLIHLRWSF